MTIRHLEIFIAVADTGKMKAAAEQLYISQPSVSQAIQELENHYDVKLFDRLNQRIYITESGKKLLPYARHIVASVEECEQALQYDREHPIIRIGGSVSVGTALLEQYIDRFEKCSYADVQVVINNTAYIEKQVVTNQIDIAIVEGNVESPELIQKVVNEDELFMVVGKNHPMYEHPDITMDMLNGQALISREDGSVDRNQFEQLLREQNIHMEKKWVCSNVQAIINAVIAGRGIGILSSLLIQDEIKRQDLRVLNIKNVHMNRKIKLIYHKNKYLTEAMKTFIDVCSDESACN